MRTPAPTGGFDGPSQCDRAGAHCAPLQPVYQHHQQARRHLRHLRQRNNLQVSGASRGEAGKAAADAYSKVKDGGAISRYHPLSKSHRRRVRSTKLKIKHQSTEGAPCLGVLRGQRIRAVPPLRGAKARLSGHLSALLPTFLTQKKGKDV